MLCVLVPGGIRPGNWKVFSGILEWAVFKAVGTILSSCFIWLIFLVLILAYGSMYAEGIRFSGLALRHKSKSG